MKRGNHRVAGQSVATVSSGFRRRLLAGASLSAMMAFAVLAGPVQAASPAAFSQAWLSAKMTAAGRSTGGSAGAIPGTQLTAQSLQNIQQSITNLKQAAQAIASAQAAQSAARAAALALPSAVPNGLTPGGLQPASGYANPATNVWQNAQLGANAQTVAGGHTTVTVTQTAPQAILNWTTFNIGQNTTLVFDQSAGSTSDSSWVALNRVNDPSAHPSQILGAISAPGHVYVINRNGIIFGGGSQVNVNALIASTADIDDNQFTANGIYNGTTPSFTNAGTGAVVVQAGAQITTNGPISVVDGGGSVILMGSRVENDGSISTPNGQTVLAAGQDFILRPGYSVSGTNPDGTPIGSVTSTTLGSEVAVNGGGVVTNNGLSSNRPPATSRWLARR